MGVRGSRDQWDAPGGWEPAPSAAAFLARQDEGADLLTRLQRAIAENPVLMPDRGADR
jgi:hypothetical protein